MLEINYSLAYKNVSNFELRKRLLFYSTLQHVWLLRIGLFFLKIYPIFFWILKPLIKSTIFHLFIGGEDLKEVSKTIQNLEKKNILTILDPAVEAKLSLKEWIKAREAFEEAIHFAGKTNAIPFVSMKVSSLISVSMLEKLTLNKTLNAYEQEHIKMAKERFEHLVKIAHQKKISLLIDSEESWMQTAVDDWTQELALKYNTDFPTLFFTVQLYRKDKLQWMKELHKTLQKNKCIAAFKIVRGAYKEQEDERALKEKRESPIFDTKDQTDISFREGLQYCLNHLNHLYLIVATHNEEDTIFTCNFIKNIDNTLKEKVHFSQLFGMRDAMTFALAQNNFSVSKYLPYGKVKDSLYYLIRRAIENYSAKAESKQEMAFIKRELYLRKSST